MREHDKLYSCWETFFYVQWLIISIHSVHGLPLYMIHVFSYIYISHMTFYVSMYVVGDQTPEIRVARQTLLTF